MQKFASPKLGLLITTCDVLICYASMNKEFWNHFRINRTLIIYILNTCQSITIDNDISYKSVHSPPWTQYKEYELFELIEMKSLCFQTFTWIAQYGHALYPFISSSFLHWHCPSLYNMAFMDIHSRQKGNVQYRLNIFEIFTKKRFILQNFWQSFCN